MSIQSLIIKFAWDEKKRRANLKKHGIDFVRVVRHFDRLTVVRLDEHEDYGEDRLVAIDDLGDVFAVVVFSMPDDETIRIISARKATRHECKDIYS
ncbi:MAG: BrnT family toxin [Sulfuricaulis sp.]|nr:BrnT family toxin [Sulfuricaulis sp.]